MDGGDDSGRQNRNCAAIEGSLRGLGRPMTPGGSLASMRKQLGKAVKSIVFVQIESGGRPHLTQHDAQRCSPDFFGVYRGFLVNDRGISHRIDV